MLRIWGKILARGRIKESMTVEDDHSEWPFEERVSLLEDELVNGFDLPRPIWLPKNREELKEFGATRFDQDNFIESFPYQYFEMEIIEKDDPDEA